MPERLKTRGKQKSRKFSATLGAVAGSSAQLNFLSHDLHAPSLVFAPRALLADCAAVVAALAGAVVALDSVSDRGRGGGGSGRFHSGATVFAGAGVGLSRALRFPLWAITRLGVEQCLVLSSAEP